jgi:hypothetical protein
MVSPVHGDYRRCQAETPLIDLFKFASPALRRYMFAPGNKSIDDHGTSDIQYMMITVAELEEIIARTPAGERVVYNGKEIGSTDAIAEKLSRLKLSRGGDPHYVIFVGVDKSGECLLTAFPTMGDPLEFRARHRIGAFPGIGKSSGEN